MSWLLEDPTSLYLFLGVLGLILLVLWWRSRNRRLLYGVGVVVLVGILVWVLGFTANTDGKQIRDSIDAMGAAVRNRDVDGLFRHIADDFTARGLDRARFRELVQRAIRERMVTEIVVWNFEPAKVKRQSRTQGTATIAFDVKPRGGFTEGLFGRCEATFTLDKDGKWKLKTFEVYNPPPGPHQPMTIPGF